MLFVKYQIKIIIIAPRMKNTSYRRGCRHSVERSWRSKWHHRRCPVVADLDYQCRHRNDSVCRSVARHFVVGDGRMALSIIAVHMARFLETALSVTGSGQFGAYHDIFHSYFPVLLFSTGVGAWSMKYRRLQSDQSRDMAHWRALAR